MEKRKRRSGEEAFTLIEIMVVVAIIGLLTGLVAVNVVNYMKKAERKAAMAQIKNFMTALDTYRMDCGRYPTSDQGLKALVAQSSMGNVCRNYPPGGYLQGGIPRDPWGNSYVYMSPGLNNEEYSVESYGADGMQGGEGDGLDVQSWALGDYEK
jgi:general secretion pathway protein G